MGKMKHSIGNWVAGMFAGALVLMVAAGGLYLSVSSQMAAYDDYLACNPRTGLSRLDGFSATGCSKIVGRRLMAG